MVEIGLHGVSLVEPGLGHHMLTIVVAQVAIDGAFDLFFVLRAFAGIEIVERSVRPAVDGLVEMSSGLLVSKVSVGFLEQTVEALIHFLTGSGFQNILDSGVIIISFSSISLLVVIVLSDSHSVNSDGGLGDSSCVAADHLTPSFHFLP